jgi:hypothetical protein
MAVAVAAVKAMEGGTPPALDDLAVAAHRSKRYQASKDIGRMVAANRAAGATASSNNNNNGPNTQQPLNREPLTITEITDEQSPKKKTSPGSKRDRTFSEGDQQKHGGGNAGGGSGRRRNDSNASSGGANSDHDNDHNGNGGGQQHKRRHGNHKAGRGQDDPNARLALEIRESFFRNSYRGGFR